MIGADTPSLSVWDLQQAGEWLKSPEEKRYVVGPAWDGGFYLFAANFSLGRDVWTAVSYSEPTTLTQLERLISADAKGLRLASRSDVDTLADLQTFMTESLAAISPEARSR